MKAYYCFVGAKIGNDKGIIACGGFMAPKTLEQANFGIIFAFVC